MADEVNHLLRQLPRIDRSMEDARLASYPPALRRHVLRAVLEQVRARVLAGELAELPDVVEAAGAQARELLGEDRGPVLNATGVVLHTNLGRAPWAPEALREVSRRARGYIDLELDLPTGRRGGRTAGPERLLCYLTGAEAACVVNNCAAAVLLCLTALARGREVLVSRGELVEIGGSFRIPDVIASGGARLVGVGTTNRTRIADYAQAIGEQSAVLLKVHRSNFALVGFTESADRRELAELAHAHELYAVEDLGSGALGSAWAPGEPSAREAVAAGLDVVCFSGDKLLGGPQAGLIVGRSAPIRALRSHPMYRALRLDKAMLAALEATLALHAREQPPPAARMLATSAEVLRERAEALARELQARGVSVRVSACADPVGGGALPGREISGWAVQLLAEDAPGLARRLRTGAPPVVGRVSDGRLALHLRSLAPEALSTVAGAVARAVGLQSSDQEGA